MSEPLEVVMDRLNLTIQETIDSQNRLAALLQRNTQAVTWLAAVYIWMRTPFWKRGKAPKWPA